MNNNYAIQLKNNKYLEDMSTLLVCSIPIAVLKEAILVLTEYKEIEIIKLFSEILSTKNKSNFLVRDSMRLEPTLNKIISFKEEISPYTSTSAYDFYRLQINSTEQLGRECLVSKEYIEANKSEIFKYAEVSGTESKLAQALERFIDSKQLNKKKIRTFKMKIKGSYGTNYFQRAAEVAVEVREDKLVNYILSAFNEMKEYRENPELSLIDPSSIKIIKHDNSFETFENKEKNYVLTAEKDEDYGFIVEKHNTALTKNLSEAFIFSSLVDMQKTIEEFNYAYFKNIIPVEINLAVNFKEVLKQNMTSSNKALEQLKSLAEKKELIEQINKLHSLETIEKPKTKHKI